MVCWTVIVTTDCEYYTLMVSTLFKVGDTQALRDAQTTTHHTLLLSCQHAWAWALSAQLS